MVIEVFDVGYSTRARRVASARSHAHLRGMTDSSLIRAARGLGLAAVLVGLALSPSMPASADDSRSRILDSPSRSTVYRGEPVPRSLRPGDRTVSRSLSGMIGDLKAAGPSRATSDRGSGGSPIYDCVLHHERLERTGRQHFPTYCDPTSDVDTGYPAFTTR